MENILNEIRKLQQEINDCEQRRLELSFEFSRKGNIEDRSLYEKIEANRKRMAEILLNETPVYHVEVA